MIVLSFSSKSVLCSPFTAVSACQGCAVCVSGVAVAATSPLCRHRLGPRLTYRPSIVHPQTSQSPTPRQYSLPRQISSYGLHTTWSSLRWQIRRIYWCLCCESFIYFTISSSFCNKIM